MNYLKQFKSWSTWGYSIALAFFTDRGAVFTHWRHGDYAWALNVLGGVVGVFGWALGILINSSILGTSRRIISTPLCVAEGTD